MRRNQIIMGTGVSIDIPESKNNKIFDEVFALLKTIDSRFSTYKKNSEISKYRRGEIKTKELSLDMQLVMSECLKYQKLTKGFFSANYGDMYDPTGFVKGWAIAKAGELISERGYGTFCIGIGGDILARSKSDKVWSIGIQDPKDHSKILNKLSISTGAVATSGNYERGEHIINPKTGKPTKELISLTVIGPDIIKADVLATAGFAMGLKGIEFINNQKDYQALAIAREVVALDAGRRNTKFQ